LVNKPMQTAPSRRALEMQAVVRALAMPRPRCSGSTASSRTDVDEFVRLLDLSLSVASGIKAA